MASATEVILSSANAANDTVDGDRYAALLQAAVDVFGRPLERYVRPTDTPGLLSPVVIEDHGEANGVLLVLGDRAIVAWETGRFRKTNVEAVIDRSAIRDIQRERQPETASRHGFERVTVQADKTWRLAFGDHLFDGGKSVVPFLVGYLDGSITPQFGD